MTDTVAYSDFTLHDVRRQLGLTIDENLDLFGAVQDMVPTQRFRELFDENLPLALGSNTEKARSELLVAPLLVELRRLFDRNIGLFSGLEFSVDEQKGLSGFCDFIVSRSPELYTLTAPVLMLVEAKKENLNAGLGQCLAEMVAAREFNAQENEEIEAIYGAVTTLAQNASPTDRRPSGSKNSGFQWPSTASGPRRGSNRPGCGSVSLIWALFARVPSPGGCSL